MDMILSLLIWSLALSVAELDSHRTHPTEQQNRTELETISEDKPFLMPGYYIYDGFDGYDSPEEGLLIISLCASYSSSDSPGEVYSVVYIKQMEMADDVFVTQLPPLKQKGKTLVGSSGRVFFTFLTGEKNDLVDEEGRKYKRHIFIEARDFK